MLTDSINRLDIGNFFGLIGAFILMGAMLPIIALGAISLTIMTSALIPFGVSFLIAGAGMFVFAGAFYLFATAMSMIPDGTVLNIIWNRNCNDNDRSKCRELAIFASSACNFCRRTCGICSCGMATGAAVSVLALGMSVLANSLSQIASEGMCRNSRSCNSWIDKSIVVFGARWNTCVIWCIGDYGSRLKQAAGLLSMFSSDENPFAMYIELGQHAEALNAASQGLSSIADSMSKLGEVDVGDIFEAIGEGFEEIFDVIDDIGEDTLAKFDLVAGSFKSLFSCIADILSDGLDITPLLGFMTALPMMATSIASMTSGGGGGFFGGLFGEEEESPLDSFVNSLSSMGDAMARIAPGAEAFNTLIQTLGGSAETLVNATSGLDMLTGAVYRFSEALDELGPFGMIMLGTMSALGVSQSSQQQSPLHLLVEGVGVQLILLHLQHLLLQVQLPKLKTQFRHKVKE